MLYSARRVCHAASLAGEAEATLSKRSVAIASQNEMVEHVDVKELAGLDDLAGHQDILGRGGRVAGGMVVGNDQRCRVQADGLLESGRRALLPVPTPLRTGRDRFRSSGSSLSFAP
jgi:hypothetical protein